MARELHTAEEIRDEVARLVNAGRKFPLHVPLPLLRTFEDTFEGGGANWHMPNFRSKEVHDNAAAIGRAIMDVKSRWDMRKD